MFEPGESTPPSCAVSVASLSSLTASPQLGMRLMTIASLLQEWVEGSVAYHAAVHSELRSLEAVAAACDSMALLLLLQAVRTI